MKIVSYNLNGIRSAMNKGLVDFVKSMDADILCFQELKAMPMQIDEQQFKDLGYHCYWFSAQKKGYSGVGIISKEEPVSVAMGCNHPVFDFEGRVIQLNFNWGSVISAYFPSGTSGDLRQNVKMDFLDYFYDYCQKLKKTYPVLVVCGDYNICHQAIDIHDPIGNKNNTGFLPEEREWMTKWFNAGFHDTFRTLNKEPHHYTWWSYRANARANNKGWRIDYISVTDNLISKTLNVGIEATEIHSDHCASWAEIDF
jgi:exodeoxyribonuclease-3